MKWGFTLPGSKQPLVNARVETAADKPTFSESWRWHRCIIPASWYYEWQHYKTDDGKNKTGDKYLIQPKDSSATWLGGLYRIEDDLPVFTVLTKAPTEELALHASLHGGDRIYVFIQTVFFSFFSRTHPDTD